MSSKLTIISWICRVIVAIILLQTLFFKFTGAEESKYIFSTLMGAENEAIGRIGSGVVELVAVILLFIPSLTWLGALLALGTMSGAIFSHLTKLGVVVKDDGGVLFILANVVLITSAILLYINRANVPILGNILQGKNA
ncbi:MAG TPA: DoxX family membrane protein [Pyrinomonadaceae bacterium]|nr:DoxX family membrane protein [Pyrinomonadaceae bacterium]